ncbi:FAD-dependent oxidoreductase [Sedimenticola sp.]|uniref:FAD-dependent oxidoreductase n=1 Tax=Sedimenticola sp. TaxID=1940285 RepID=UPI003D14F1AC
MTAESQETRFDIAVLGAGAAGFSAAITAALQGAKVILIERTEFVGGTSAYSAATTWVPNTRLSATVGASDSYDNALKYLDNAVGELAPRELREAFLRSGPDAIHALMDRAGIPFRARPHHPDYLIELEGGTACGRALEPLPFDGSCLGEDLKLIRPPIPEFTILGGLMVDRDDIAHLLKMGKSLRSLLYSMRLLGRYGLDRIRFGQSTRLVMGRALIGRMLFAARRLGVDIRTQTQVIDIQPTKNGTNLTLKHNGLTTQMAVRQGVILASGGFARHPKRRERLLPKPVPEYSPSAPGHTGELHDLVENIGATYGSGGIHPIFMAPVSVRKRPSGEMAAFPHFVFDRSKPGMISVGRDGRRFVNESRSYHEFSAAMFANNQQQEGNTVPTFLVTDAEGLRKYGMGMIRPGGKGMEPFLADGYLTQAESLEQLANQLEINAANLQETVARMNRFADSGVDEDFHRGETIYERANGDPNQGPNVTLGAISTPPFYAVRLYPSDIGSATGLRTNRNAQLLDKNGQPIRGLYACGNDMHSIMGGVYPGPGITIGPGIVFGYIAAMHATGDHR